ncbi:MAG TPA: DNA repair protein RecN [Bdellovibrionales bacterium]|nr:MAG: DNA repair protein RecN [Bdellovibrionales bacterium GWB1_52_6]OFZ05266.1 MAG: DNA repair protein RecN [Bdellovibrionales bacterium GWA1_52_35]OFZ42792.1 MAG: DNA repair protein RecN [Bdellovibrionales bacterium GWC1_52_8]HAR41123.1 DNA repair protein RecN [Bdellovibrionales bacterium]HCM38596.1 DNA repair protein RecN [Bdellovibrionales bacterium]
MLQTLNIKNIAIIDSAEITFKEGLNILSGETGAGKSIVIEAISLLLGSRAKAELVRSGCEEAVIEGLFDISNMSWMPTRLEKLGIDNSGSELLIKRTIHQSGKHRIHVNGQLATLAILQELCEGLVDLCGQHEHQSLTKPLIQLGLLDQYGEHQDQALKVAKAVSQLRALRDEQYSIQKSEAEREKRLDFLKFQIEELKTANLREGEDEVLLREKQLLQSAETRLQNAEAARQALEADGDGALNLLRAAQTKARSLRQLDEHSSHIAEALERATAEAEDATIALNRYLGSVDLNSELLVEIQERLSMIADFRRKYGATIPEMLNTLARLDEEFSSLNQAEVRLQNLDQEISSLRTELIKSGKKLSQARTKAAEQLSDAVTKELKDLKMADARFHVELNTLEKVDDWTSSGADQIQFTIQTNRGEPARPLGKIASGGELSRLMLAVRRIISDHGNIGVYLFDEVDAGIGGQVAFEVGKKLKSVAKNNQVLCITHLPQVASFADHHLIVRKDTKGSRTMTEVLPLGKTERKEELARMLGGPQLTKKSLENASELLELARI